LQITPKIFLHKFNRFYRKKYITLFKKYYQYTDLLFFVEFIYFYIFTKLINIEDIESIPLLGKQLSLYYILTEKKLIVFFWDIASFTLKPFKVKITGIRRRFRQNFLMSLSFFFKINTYLPLTKFFTFIQFFNFFFFFRYFNHKTRFYRKFLRRLKRRRRYKLITLYIRKKLKRS